jgi:hypothetical protein
MNTSKTKLKALVVSAIAAVLVVLSGCSSTSKPSQGLAESLANQRYLEKAESQARADEFDKAPSWAVSPAASTQSTLVATASASSTDMQTALQKATVLAQYRLAKQVKSLAEGYEESSMDEGQTLTSYMKVSVPAVETSGAKITRMDFQVLSGKFFAYVEMSMPRPARAASPRRPEPGKASASATPSTTDSETSE